MFVLKAERLLSRGNATTNLFNVVYFIIISDSKCSVYT